MELDTTITPIYGDWKETGLRVKVRTRFGVNPQLYLKLPFAGRQVMKAKRLKKDRNFLYV